MSTEPDRVTVLFAEHGYKTLALDAVRENDLPRARRAGLRPVAGYRRGLRLRGQRRRRGGGAGARWAGPRPRH